MKSLKGFQLDCFDSRFKSLNITKNKILIGSAELCDLVIQDDSVSFIHAMIIVRDEGLEIFDLSSKNGTKINGEKVDKSFLSEGDVVSFSKVQFKVQESVIPELIDLDKDVRLAQNSELTIAEPEKTGLVLIDDEYCDIVFENEELQLVEDINHIDVGRKNYIDPFEYSKEIQKDVVVDHSKLAIEVSILSAGSLIDCEVIDLKSSRFLNKELNKCFQFLDEHLTVQNNNGKILIQTSDNVTKRYIDSNEKLTGNQCELSRNKPISFVKGVNEITFNMIEITERVNPTSFFMKDPVLLKESSKVVGAVLGIALLLLLVDTTIPKPEKKKEFVIYKKKAIPEKVVQEKSSETVANKEVDNGTQMDKSDKVIQKAVAKNNPEPVKKVAKPKQQPKPKKVVKSKPKPKPTPVKKVVKSKPKFKLKLRKSLKGVIAQTKVSNVKTRQMASINTSSSVMGASQLSETGGVKTLSNLGEGSSLSGNYSKTKGIKGSSTKRGIDMANTSRKTVVLGSMDPELLRKILREYLPQFRHCYQAELDANDSSQGTVDLNFRINGSGKVSSVKVKGRKFSQGTVNCLGSVLKLIQFPKPKGGGIVDVRQPLNFSSSKNRI